MAISPIFVADLPTLKSRLRLSGVGASADAEKMIEGAVLTVRSNLQRALGTARLGVLASYAHSDAPANDNEYLRLLAEETEVKWVRMELMRALPMLFMDGSGNSQQVWNDEAPFRQAGSFSIGKEIDRLQAEILQNLDALRGDMPPGEEATIKTTDLIPDSEPPAPGDSVWDPNRDVAVSDLGGSE